MKVSRYSETETIQDVKGVFRRDVLTADDGVTVVCMQIIEISSQSSTPSHYHPWEHELFIISGKGLAVGNEGSIPIDQGTIVFIPANEPHCFVNTGNDTLRFICIEPLKKE
jgi:quercetin dioxygenase-like cupin family protein